MAEQLLHPSHTNLFHHETFSEAVAHAGLLNDAFPLERAAFKHSPLYISINKKCLEAK